MVHISIEKIDLKLESMMDRLKAIEKKLHWGEDFSLFFKGGLDAYKERILKDSPLVYINSPINSLNRRLFHDKDLRFPHRKILEFLLQQYDFRTNQFKEVHFSKLVKETRIGKNMANDYLALLEYKGYIKKRNDGYRKFFRIREVIMS